MSSKEVVDCVWDQSRNFLASNVHEQCVLGTENIIRNSLERKTSDNVTAVMIALPSFKKKLFPETEEKKIGKEPRSLRVQDEMKSLNSGFDKMSIQGSGNIKKRPENLKRIY